MVQNKRSTARPGELFSLLGSIRKGYHGDLDVRYYVFDTFGTRAALCKSRKRDDIFEGEQGASCKRDSWLDSRGS